MSRALKNAAYGELARLGKALANPLRLEILDVLAQAPRDVAALSEATDRPLASVSQHLQVLAGAKLVERQRDGTHVIYGLAPGVEPLLARLTDVGMSRLAELPAHREALAPNPASLPPEALPALLAQPGVSLLDVRPPEEFAHGHLPGARSVPLAQLDAVLSELPADGQVIVYCRGPWCTWADEAVLRLQERGIDARRLEGRPTSEALSPGA